MYGPTYRSDLSSQMSMEGPSFVVDDDDIIEETFEQSRADRIISLTPKCRITFDRGTSFMSRAIATGDVNGDSETELAVGSMNGIMMVYKMNFNHDNKNFHIPSLNEEIHTMHDDKFSTPFFSAYHLGTIVDIFIGSIYPYKSNARLS